MIVFRHILSDLHALLIANFLPAWIALMAATAIASAVFVGRAAATRGRWLGGSTSVMPPRRPLTGAGLAALVVLGLFLVGYGAMILAGENFAYYDNSFFTLGTLKGHDIAPPIWPDQGRFFPLGFQEFNLIRHFTASAIGYHLLPIAELLIFVFILLILDDELDIPVRVALAILVLLTPAILISFSGLIFPERNELFFLAGLLLCVKRFERTAHIRWAVAAVVCAQFFIYYKETAFLILFGFAAGRLLMRCRNAEHGGWDWRRLWDGDGRLDFVLIGVAVLFLLSYFAFMGLHRTTQYAVARRHPFTEVLAAYTRLDLLAPLLMAVVFGRLYLILRRRMVPVPLWDGLALGGVAGLLAYLYLRIFSPWYLAPIDLIAVLYIGRFAVLSLKRMRAGFKSWVLALVIAVVFQDLLLSSLAVFERKNSIRAKAEIAHVVEERYRDNAGAPLRLFFPFANPYVIMEFAAYLEDREMPAAGDTGAGPGSIILATRSVAEDGPCVGYREEFRCRAARRPLPGDLVIVLPDDEASGAEAAPYRSGGERLFRYAPRPPIPHSLYALAGELAGNLRLTSPIFAHKRIPDRWMDGSVTLWR